LQALDLVYADLEEGNWEEGKLEQIGLEEVNLEEVELKEVELEEVGLGEVNLEWELVLSLVLETDLVNFVIQFFSSSSPKEKQWKECL
jgi:uncharacterized protein YjbI with pentapeptide repeats